MALKALKPSIAALCGVEPVRGFKKVRKLNKGLKTAYIPAILLAGDCNGFKCTQYAQVMGLPRQGAYVTLGIIISKGYLTKRRLSYQLTDTGYKVYSDTLKEMELLIQRLTKEVIKRAKRAKAI